MAATATPGTHMALLKPDVALPISSVQPCVAFLGAEQREASWAKLTSSSRISSRGSFLRKHASKAVTIRGVVTRAMSGANESTPLPGLPIDLRGKRAFIASVADDNGYGWAIAKSLAAAGAEILIGTWAIAVGYFKSSLRRGKFDESRVLPDGSLMEITRVYQLDPIFDRHENIMTDEHHARSIQGVVESVKQDFGSIDILVDPIANGPEDSKDLLRRLGNHFSIAISTSSYSSESLLRHFVPIMNPGNFRTLLLWFFYLFDNTHCIRDDHSWVWRTDEFRKAALESDTQVLAFEAGRKHKVRVNTISAVPFKSCGAKAIGAPLQKELSAEEVGNAAAFMASPLASAITGTVFYVDNGLHAMGGGVDGPIIEDLDIPKAKEDVLSPLVLGGLHEMGVGVDSPILEDLDIPKAK